MSSQLARSFADAGCRTLLVDGDLRRGELHSRFGVERRPGLLEYLAGEIALDEVLRLSNCANLTLMLAAGRTNERRAPDVTPDVEAHRGLRRGYDAIIVDSPPLGAGIDPSSSERSRAAYFHPQIGRDGSEGRRSEAQLLDRLPIRLLALC